MPESGTPRPGERPQRPYLFRTPYRGAPRGQHVAEIEAPRGFRPPDAEPPNPDEGRGRDPSGEDPGQQLEELGSEGAPSEGRAGEQPPRKPAPAPKRKFQDDPEFTEAWEYIRSMTGNAVKIKASKMGENGRYAFLSDCPMVNFNTGMGFSSLIEIQDSVASRYGPGEYMFTLHPPKETGKKPHTYFFTATSKPAPPEKPVAEMDAPRPAAEQFQAAVATEPSVSATNFIEAVKLLDDTKGDPAAKEAVLKLLGDLAERDRKNAEDMARIRMEAKEEAHKRELDALNAKFEAQSKKIDDLMAELKNPRGPDKIDKLLEAIAKRDAAPAAPSPDPAKMLADTMEAVKTMFEFMKPAVPVATNPVAPTDGKSEFERVMAAAERLQGLVSKANPATGAPAPSMSESLLSTLANQFLASIKENSQQPRGRASSLGETLDLLDKMSNILSKPGIKPVEALREIQETAEEEEAAAPGKLAGFVKIIETIVSHAAKNLGDGLSEGLARVVPQLASQMGGAANPNQIPAAQAVTAPQTHRRVTARPIPVLPPTTVRPEPQTAKAPMAAVVPGPGAKPPEAAGSPPEEPVGQTNPKPTEGEVPGANVKKPPRPLPPVVPAAAKLSDAQFQQIRALLDLGLPAKDIAQTIFATMPPEAKPYFAATADEAYEKILPHLTEDQKTYVDGNLEMIKSVYAELQVLMKAPAA